MSDRPSQNDAGRLLVVGETDLGSPASTMAARLGDRATLVAPAAVAAELARTLFDALLVESAAVEGGLPLGRLCVTHPLMPIVAVGADDALAERALAEGARELLSPDASPSLVAARLAGVLAWRRLARDTRSDARRRAGRGPWFGHSDVAEGLLEQIDLLALADAAVCLTGSAGSIPERVARAIHRAGPRSAAPFRAASPDAVDLEEQLATADGGTLFVKHVDRLGPAQRELLWENVRHGADRGCRLIVFSTEGAGSAPDALTDWLGRQTLRIPPLAERREDIAGCVEELLDRMTLEDGRTVWITDGAMGVLRAQPWDGDVAELERVVLAVRAAAPGDIDVEALPPGIIAASEADPMSEALSGVEAYGERFDRAVEAVERDAVDETIRTVGERVRARRALKKYRIR